MSGAAAHSARVGAFFAAGWVVLSEVGKCLQRALTDSGIIPKRPAAGMPGLEPM